MLPTTTEAPTTEAPTTTILPTTTVLPTTTLLTTTVSPVANTKTLTNSNATTVVTSTIVTRYTTTFDINNTNTIVNNSEYHFLSNYSKGAQQQLNRDDFIIFLILCLPIVVIIVVILYHCICKKTLKKNRVVIPQDVKIVIDDEAEEKNSNANEMDVDDENAKVTHHVVKAVVDDLITKIENQHVTKKTLPSVQTASKTLQRLQAVKRRNTRKRRERQLNSLVLRNMNTENKPLSHGMRIKEIFEQSKEENQVKKNDYDLI